MWSTQQIKRIRYVSIVLHIEQNKEKPDVIRFFLEYLDHDRTDKSNLSGNTFAPCCGGFARFTNAFPRPFAHKGFAALKTLAFFLIIDTVRNWFCIRLITQDFLLFPAQKDTPNWRGQTTTPKRESLAGRNNNEKSWTTRKRANAIPAPKRRSHNDRNDEKQRQIVPKNHTRHRVQR